MSGGGRRDESGRAVLGALLAIGAAASLAVAAYAATAPGAPDGGPAGRPAPGRLWRPTISQHPDKVAVSNVARFHFNAGRRAQGFRCRLDRRGWRTCRAPIVFSRLSPGRHSFVVRALDRNGRYSATARFRWRVLEPKAFAIVPSSSGIGTLFPGAPPTTLPLTIENPNPAPIFVTELRVAATADPPGCAREENLSLVAASLSSAAPLRVPAGGSATLPAPGILPPAIQLRNLPVNQDACQNARFPLAFSGEARG
jgi:hypothetical protein